MAASHMCKQTGLVEVENSCRNMISPLNARYIDMYKELSSISHLLEKRSKRAWVGGLGTLIKQVFGNLDENDGLRYNDAISLLQNNQKKLAALMKENILLATSTISSYNDTVNKIKFNEINLNKAIDNLSANLANVTSATNELLLQFNINQVLNNIETAILTLSFQLEDLTNAILFSSQNTLHPSVITTQQLFRELADNHQHLPNDLELPVDLDLSSTHIILNLSSLISYYTSNKIFFVLRIPLVSITEYVLFHNIALPTPHNTNKPYTFSLVVPSSKYIAMTKDKTHYCVLSDLNNCKTVYPGKYVCDIPNVYLSTTKPICETEFMTKVISEIPKICETKFIYGHLDIWKPIEHNKWIYIQSVSNKISIDCRNSNLLEVEVLGTGILTLPNNCLGYCKSTILIPKYNSLNITTPINYPDFNLLNDTCCNITKFNQLSNNVSPIQLQNLDLDDLKLNKNIFLKQLREVDNILDSSHIVKYGTHYSIIIIIIFVLMLLYVSFRLYKLYKHLRPGSSPQSRVIVVNKPCKSKNDIENGNSEHEEIPLPSIRRKI